MGQLAKQASVRMLQGAQNEIQVRSADQGMSCLSAGFHVAAQMGGLLE